MGWGGSYAVLVSGVHLCFRIASIGADGDVVNLPWCVILCCVVYATVCGWAVNARNAVQLSWLLRGGDSRIKSIR